MFMQVQLPNGCVEDFSRVEDATITDSGCLHIQTTNEVHGYATGAWTSYSVLKTDDERDVDISTHSKKDQKGKM